MSSKVIFSQDQLSELKDLMDKGVRQIDIAKHFGVTDDTIRRICRTFFILMLERLELVRKNITEFVQYVGKILL